MNPETRKVRAGGHVRLLPSSHEDSWEQARRLVVWQREFDEYIAGREPS